MRYSRIYDTKCLGFMDLESRMKRYLMAGLLVWLPLGVTLFVVKALVSFMDRSLALLPEAYQPDTLIGFHVPGLGAIFLLILVLITGFFTANFFGKRVVKRWEQLMERIPLVRSIYSAVSQVVKSMVLTDGNSFRRVLLIEYPRKGVWSIAFQTNDNFHLAREAVDEPMVLVFVPTTPNPTSGFIVAVPAEQTIPLDMSVDDALKSVISLGLVLPNQPK